MPRRRPFRVITLSVFGLSRVPGLQTTNNVIVAYPTVTEPLAVMETV